MAPQKIRAFLDTNVLLEYFDGKAELQHLFSDDVRDRVAFAVNSIVLQELILSYRMKDLTRVEPFLEILELGVDPSAPETKAMLRDERHRDMHINDILILAGARSCDVLLTYDDQKLRHEKNGARVRLETPEEFLNELGVAA
ncbi:MAG TPA: PIN domain-containing protein [Thermoanaerobaculia bacterium]|jgi:predicted nucleic acid-binding protein|nr:PIN domain-containing protein [Thermoanaerobaculia bacterium]